MTLKYNLEIADFAELNKYLLKTHKNSKKSRWILTGIFSGLLFILGLVLPKYPLQGASMFLFIYCMTLSALGLIFLPWLFRKWMLKKSIKDMSKPGNALAFGSREITFDENGVHVKTEFSEETLKWVIVNKVEEVPSAYLVYISELAFHLIPKAKLTAAETDEFKEVLATYVANVPLNFKKSNN